VRSIPADPVIVRVNWLRAYDFTNSTGAAALNDYARADDPFAKIGRQQIAVRWSAILSVLVQTPHDADRLRKNPLGIYVTAINWSKELGQ